MQTYERTFTVVVGREAEAREAVTAVSAWRVPAGAVTTDTGHLHAFNHVCKYMTPK